jgi:hypothetical protein
MIRSMRELVASGSPDDATTRLTQAWEFLCAQPRAFKHLQTHTDLLRFTDFSFFMSLAVDDQTRAGGIGVLIDREDGLAVASHLFGVPASEVSEGDLDDACAEACNVLADCVAQDIAPGRRIRLTLPRRVSASEYDSIVENSRALAVYQGEAGGHSLFVVRAEGLHKSS